MMNQISFTQYRGLDLTIWAVITIVFEGITTVATDKWFYAQPIAMSVTLMLTCILMMRWGAYAGIHALLGGFVFCLLSGATVQQYLIYMIGNMFALIALVMFARYKKEEVRNNPFRLTVFILIAYVGMAIGRWGVSLFFGGDVNALLVYLTTDIISLLFAVVILNLLRKTDGMLEDQKAYLLRIEKEEMEGNYEN